MSDQLNLDASLPRGKALRLVAAKLGEAGVEEPLREARLLLCAALNISLAALVASENEALGAAGAEVFSAFARRRLAREPFARITGMREFYGLTFTLSPATLIPRPDTETLVEAVLAEAKARAMVERPIAIADLGVGSGAILATLLHALPTASGLAVDISAEALATAQANIERLAGANRAEYRLGSWLTNLDQRFDIIVSNPPYIPTSELAALEPEVTTGDPLLALDGGPDGLAPYRTIAAEARPALETGGFIALEIGAGQEADVIGIFAGHGFALLSQHRDLGGHVRALLFA